MLTLIYAFNSVDRSLFGLMVPLIKADLQLSDTMIGALAGAMFSIFYASAAIPIAALADRYSRRNIIAIGLAVWSLATLCHGFARNVGQLAFTRFLLGAGEASSIAPSNSMVADLFSPAHRPLAMGILASSASLGIMIAFPILGHLAQSHGWRAAFVAAGVPGVLIAALFFLTVREPPRIGVPSGSEAAVVPLRLALGALFRTPAYVWTVAAGVLMGFDLAVTFTWAPSMLERVHGLSPAETGSAVGLLRGIGGVAGAIAVGWLAGANDRRWRYWAPALAMFLTVPAQLLLLFGDDPMWRVGLFAETFLIIGQGGQLFALLIVASDPRTRAVAVATFLFVSNLVGQTTGPILPGLISEGLRPAFGAGSIRYAMLVGPLAALAASGCCIAAGRRLDRSAMGDGKID
jgi:predicted MFS family arabinose efflux permease